MGRRAPGVDGERVGYGDGAQNGLWRGGPVRRLWPGGPRLRLAADQPRHDCLPVVASVYPSVGGPTYVGVHPRGDRAAPFRRRMAARILATLREPAPPESVLQGRRAPVARAC